MEKENKNEIVFEYRWIFTPDSEPGEKDIKYRKFLKKMYLGCAHSSLVLIKKDFTKREKKEMIK